MIELLFIGTALALLVGFVVLIQYETRRGGVRVFAATRSQFDTTICRWTFVLEHVDFIAFARDEIGALMIYIGHALARISLQAVRSVERLLTRAVRHFRMQHPDTTGPRENAREFVKTLSDFKDNLNATHPKIEVLGRKEE